MIEQVCLRCGQIHRAEKEEDCRRYCATCNTLLSAPDSEIDKDAIHCIKCGKKIVNEDINDSCPFCEEPLEESFVRCAEGGNADAQYAVALNYMNFKRDFNDGEYKRLAKEFMKKAAEQGHAAAKRMIRRAEFAK